MEGVGCARIDTRYVEDKHLRTRTDIATRQLDFNSAYPSSSPSSLRFSPENISMYIYLRIRILDTQWNSSTGRQYSRESFVAGFAALSIFFRLVPRLFRKVGACIRIERASSRRFQSRFCPGYCRPARLALHATLYFSQPFRANTLPLESRTRIFQSPTKTVGNIGSRDFLRSYRNLRMYACIRVTFGKDPRARKTVAGNLEFNRVTAVENIVPLSGERAMETTSARAEGGDAKIYPGTISALGSTRARVCVHVRARSMKDGKFYELVNEYNDLVTHNARSFARLTEGNSRLYRSFSTPLPPFPYQDTFRR